MDQKQHWPAPSRAGGGGSVKRARQRMEAGLPRGAPLQDQNPFEMEDPRPAPSPPRPLASPRNARPAPPSQALPETKIGPSPIGVAISKPTQIPQWPLQGTIEHVNDTTQSPSPPRGPAPQRPKRPSRVPSILDSSKVQAPMPSFRYASQQRREIPPRDLGRQPFQQMQSIGAQPTTSGRPLQQTPYDGERSRLPLRALQQQQYQQTKQGVPRNTIRPLMTIQSNNTRQARNPFEDAASPVESNPTSFQSSLPSTTSTAGAVPDNFVPPSITSQRQRSMNLGPPPSSRRGTSSYYSQTSYVSPIPEVSERESPRAQQSHGSYASSAAIPSSWGDASPGSSDLRSDDYGDFEDNVIDERGESRASTLDESEGRTLIRSASLGKRAKPSMVTTKSAEKIDAAACQVPEQKSKLERMGFPESVTTGIAVGTAGFAAAKTAERHIAKSKTSHDSLASGTGLIDISDSSSAISALDIANAITIDGVAAPPRAKLNDKDMDSRTAMLGAYNAASSLRSDVVPNQRFSRLSAFRRPPRLNIDAVRDAEARGSLTSLPDLIRRATRLAHMIDKGKRPGSGMDLNDFPSISPLKLDRKAYQGLSSDPDEKRQSGLSGMLAAFPPPGPTPNGLSPSPFGRRSDIGYDSIQGGQHAKSRRKCCGLSLPVFLTLVFILLIVITAAVVVPLKLLVLDKQSSDKPDAAAPISQGSCQSSSTTACQNGGTTTTMMGSQCGCICINGFTGSTCRIAGATGCTTSNLTSTDGSNISNVTLGGSLPRLLSQANANFSIPLSANNVLARFNSASLSCSAQNALVTFDGQSESNVNQDDLVTPIATARLRRQVTDLGDTASTDTVPPPAASTTTSYTTTTVSDSESIAPTTAVSAVPSITPTPTPTSSISSPSSTSSLAVTSQVLDFARIVVLFVLQQEDLKSATNAQSALQKVFSQETFTTAAAQNISIGDAKSVDLVNFTLDLGNGIVGGGTNGTTSSGSMRRAVVWSQLLTGL